MRLTLFVEQWLFLVLSLVGVLVEKNRLRGSYFLICVQRSLFLAFQAHHRHGF